MNDIVKNRSSHLNTQTVIALGFALLILFVTLVLMLPACSAAHTWTTPLTALFTAVSAVCVTGLTVVDTASYWSPFGQAVILFSIQAGGLGVMTSLALASMMLRRRIGLRQRTLLAQSIAALNIGGVVRLVRFSFFFALLAELLGAAFLCFRFIPMLGLLRGIWYSVFHAVSAFCNAGFDLTGSITGPFSSLECFVSDSLVCLTLLTLIFLGGLGFLVFHDLFTARLQHRRLQLHTRVVLLLAPPLLILPACLFILFERCTSMAGMDVRTRLLAGLFLALSPRTAGFSTLPAGSLSPASVLLTLVLMLVGGNPGSTAGGAKTTTVLILFLLASSILRQDDDILLFGRRLPDGLMRRACSIVIVYMIAALSAALAVCALQPELPLQDVLLEVFSAINTVGMSTGITRMLRPASLMIIMLLMYAGRLGSLTLFILIVRRPHSTAVRRPVDRLLIG